MDTMACSLVRERGLVVATDASSVSRNAIAKGRSPTTVSFSRNVEKSVGLCFLSNNDVVRKGRRLGSCKSVAVEEAQSAGTQAPTPAPVPIEKQFPAFPTVLDINQIRSILPHRGSRVACGSIGKVDGPGSSARNSQACLRRFPFLLVDRVIEFNPGVSAVAIKNVTINDNFFPGHFPERPIMPGVLMVEAMAQVGGIVMLNPEVGGSKDNFFFAGVDKVRFRKPVVAGDTLVMRMNLVKLQRRFGIVKMEGKAYVGGEVVCEGDFLMAMGTSE